MNKLNPRRGEIWFVDLDPTRGHEQARKRPCLVISTNQFNQSHRAMAGILPLTTKEKSIPWFVKIEPPEGGLKQTSFVICDQLRMVSHDRFIGRAIGTINNATLLAIEYRLKILFEL